jgi:NTP pyrophosphatase (non-canonical NTP hydrolase)
MLTEAHKEVCRQAVEKFGRRHQALKVVEELRELADEAAVEGFGSAERIIDERADVALVLYQLDELLMTMACVAAHAPGKIKKLQRYLEVDDV